MAITCLITLANTEQTPLTYNLARLVEIEASLPGNVCFAVFPNASARSSKECTRAFWSQIAAATISSSAPVASINGLSFAPIVSGVP